MSQYANTLDTVLKTELAVIDSPASHHTSRNTLSISGHSPVLRSTGQNARRCGRRGVSCRLVLRHFHYVTPPTHFSGYVYFHYVTPHTFLCRNEDFFNFFVIYFNDYFNSNLDMNIYTPSNKQKLLVVVTVIHHLDKIFTIPVYRILFNSVNTLS